jgi:hypothetical protein
VRVGIVERLDDALQRGVVELLLIDRLVEVVLDRVDDLGPHRPVLLDEGIAHRPRQFLGVPSEPEPGDQRDQHAERCNASIPHQLEASRRGLNVAKRAGIGAA